MNKNNVKFSVIIPTKGRATLVGATIKSVIDQDFDNFEVVVVDNNNEDETTQVVANFKSNKIKHIKTGGLAMHENWMTGLMEATGIYTLLIEDKVLLKQGALTFLDALIEKTKCEIITYEEDSYYDKEELYLPRTKGQNIDIYDTKSIISMLLKCDFHAFSAVAPRAVNTCFKTELAQKISQRSEPIFAPLAPDYMFCYHMLFCTSNVVHAHAAMTICRFRSLYPPVGYGNGASYFNKTETWLSFLKDQKHEIEKHYANVPIKALIVYNFLLNDFIHVAGLYNESDVEFDKEKYYVVNYLDLSVRASHSINVRQEIEEWRRALSSEDLEIRISVHSSLLKQYLKEPLYPLVRGLQGSMLYECLSVWLGRERWKRDLVSFEGLAECWTGTSIPTL